MNNRPILITGVNKVKFIGQGYDQTFSHFTYLSCHQFLFSNNRHSKQKLTNARVQLIKGSRLFSILNEVDYKIHVRMNKILITWVGGIDFHLSDIRQFKKMNRYGEVKREWLVEMGHVVQLFGKSVLAAINSITVSKVMDSS